MRISKDLNEFIGLLNSHKVEFILVGAHALAWHGLPRYTKDIDFLVNPQPANSERLMQALDVFGFGSVGLNAADFQSKDQIVQLGREPNRIDLLTGISGVEWTEAWNSKVQGQIGEVPVYVLGREAYLKNKRASGRPQDIADASRLSEMYDDSDLG